MHTQTTLGNQASSVCEGGPRPGGSPCVWVLVDDRPGNTTQSLGLARALGWPYEVKELHFTGWVHLLHSLFGAWIATKIGLDSSHSAALAPPWPDVVIATGWRPAPVARWISKQSQGRTRLVQLGRKGGCVAGLFDVVVSCPYFRLPPHPRRIEIAAPLTQVTPERLAEAAERWQHLFDNTPHPRIALLVGGPTARYRLDVETARCMGERVQTFAHTVGGSVFASTSRRTGVEAAEALQTGLGETSHMHQWQLGQQDNPYLAYLALADVLVVTGESESMLAEAAATGKPVYIYTLPERPFGLAAQLKEWVLMRAQAESANIRGTARLQQGLACVCAWLIKHGIVRPRRDLNILHQTLVRRGIARFFREPSGEPSGEPLDMRSRPVLREIDDVARQVRILLGIGQNFGQNFGQDFGQD